MPDSREFDGRPVAVVGTATGIGRATALAFATRGAHVAALDVNTRSLDGFAEAQRAAACS